MIVTVRKREDLNDLKKQLDNKLNNIKIGEEPVVISIKTPLSDNRDRKIIKKYILDTFNIEKYISIIVTENEIQLTNNSYPTLDYKCNMEYVSHGFFSKKYYKLYKVYFDFQGVIDDTAYYTNMVNIILNNVPYYLSFSNLSCDGEYITGHFILSHLEKTTKEEYNNNHFKYFGNVDVDIEKILNENIDSRDFKTLKMIIDKYNVRLIELNNANL